ncbi:MAG: hypothetical protein ABJG47_02990 [Ekhidna sp.]
MRFLMCLAIFALAFGCNPNQKVIEENELLRAENEKLKREVLFANKEAVHAQVAAQETADQAGKMSKDFNATYERMEKQLADCK